MGIRVFPANAIGKIGEELGYVERDSNDTTANTTIGNAPANKISGLVIPNVIGVGRPVEVEFFCPAVVSSVASNYVGVALLVNGVQQKIGQQSSPVTTSGRTLIVKRRLVLLEDEEYTFEVGKYGQAGASTYGGAPTFPMYLSVVQR